MKRRAFIKGAVSAAVAASLPGGDGVALNSIAHPQYTYKTFKTAEYWGPSIVTTMDTAQRMANALAKSILEVKDMSAVNVFHRGLSASSLEEIEVEIDNDKRRTKIAISHSRRIAMQASERRRNWIPIPSG